VVITSFLRISLSFCSVFPFCSSGEVLGLKLLKLINEFGFLKKRSLFRIFMCFLLLYLVNTLLEFLDLILCQIFILLLRRQWIYRQTNERKNSYGKNRIGNFLFAVMFCQVSRTYRQTQSVDNTVNNYLKIFLNNLFNRNRKIVILNNTKKINNSNK
jgi:hypothetical protein